jgi:methylthioribose-1-phosphate isomerase
MSVVRYFNWNHKTKAINFIDQTLLPLQEKIRTFTDYRVLADAIRHLVVRGAPAIGIAGGYGVAIASHHEKAKDLQELKTKLKQAIDVLSKTRPTAVNLFWALKRMENIIDDRNIRSIDRLREEITNEAISIDNEEYKLGVKLGEIGSEIIPDKCIALTHCNAGGLATSGMGSALSVFYYAREKGKDVKVFVDETRPLLQGGRLTTYELMKWGIKCELICDNMAGLVMKTKGVNMVLTGCDRVASNGDTANKIGTYSLSVLAKYHNIPMYIGCPLSTIDFDLESGEEIPIEERNQEEVTNFRSERIAPFNTAVYNPAFDVTPAKNITGFITEEGIITPPFKENLAKLKKIWENRKQQKIG